MTAIRTGAFGEYTDGGNGVLPMQVLEANALSPQELMEYREAERRASAVPPVGPAVLQVPGKTTIDVKSFNGDAPPPVNPVTPLAFDTQATLPRRAKDHTWRDKAYITMTQPTSSLQARMYNLFILACVVLGILCTCFMTIWRFNYAWVTMNILLLITSIILILDIGIRFYVYPGDPKMRFWKKPENVFFLIGIIATFIAMGIFGFNYITGNSVSEIKVVVEAFFAISLLRIAYLYNSFQTIQLLFRVLGRAKDGVAAAIILFCTAVVFYAGIFFYVETNTGAYFDFESGVWLYYPWVLGTEDVPCVVQNSVDAWWLLGVTMVTVGYGDVSPKTIGGKVVMGFAFLTILIMFPLPGALISATLVDMYNEDRQLRDELMKEFDVNNDGKLDLEERIAIQKEMDRRRMARKAMEKEMKSGKKKIEESTETLTPNNQSDFAQAASNAAAQVPSNQPHHDIQTDLAHVQGRVESMHIRMDMLDQKFNTMLGMLQQISLK